MKAEQRRALVVRAAVVEFGHGGFQATSTASIAQRSGVSQPYLFRLFASKKALFAAAADWCLAQLSALLAAAAEGKAGEEALRAMAEAYGGVAGARRDDFHRFQLALYAAAGDPELRELARRNFQTLWSAVADAARADEPAVREFFADAALVMIRSAIEAPEDPARAGQAHPHPHPRRRPDLLALAERLAARPGLTDRLETVPGQRTWSSLSALSANDGVEAWLIGWPPGTGTPWHDHGGAEGAMTVVAGELAERSIEAPAAHDYTRPLPLPGGTGHLRLIPAGRGRAFSGQHVHEVTNRGRDTAFSVHIYAPALPAMRHFRQHGGSLVFAGSEAREDW